MISIDEENIFKKEIITDTKKIAIEILKLDGYCFNSEYIFSCNNCPIDLTCDKHNTMRDRVHEIEQWLLKK